MYRFNFNLIPEKPKELVIKEEKRENVSLYIAFFPLFSIIIAIGLMLFNQYIVLKRVDTWNETTQARSATIESFRGVVVNKYNFVSKAVLLEEPVTRDIAPERFFTLSEKLSSALDFTIKIRSYGRNPDGSFSIKILLDNIDNTGKVLSAFEAMDDVITPNANSISVDVETKEVEMQVNFFLKEEEIVE